MELSLKDSNDTVNQSLSVVCTFDDQQRYESVIYTTVVTCTIIGLWLFGCVTNGLVLTLVLRKHMLRTTTNILLANFAVIGLLFFLCAVSISIWVTANRGYWHLYEQCQVNGFTSITLAAATWFNHAIVNIEEYIKIISPLRKRFTMAAAVISCTCIWAISIGMGVLALISPNGYSITDTQLFCGPDYRDYTSSFMTLYSLVLLASLAAMLFSQIGVYRVHRRIHNRSRQRARPIGIFTNPESQTENVEREGNNQDDSQTTHDDSTQRDGGKTVQVPSSLSFSSSSSSASSEDRYNMAKNVKNALAIFQSSLVYISLFVMNIAAAVAVDNFYPQDKTKCSFEGTPSFYYGTVHTLLFLLVMATAPLIYVRGNTPLKKAIKDTVKKIGNLKSWLFCR